MRTDQILERAHDAYVAIDAEGTIFAWNAAAQRTFGWSRAEVLGRAIDAVLVPERLRGAHDRGIERYLRTGRGKVLDRRLELPARHRDGHELPIELMISAIEEHGRTTFHAFLHDISARKAAEARVQRLAEIVEQSSDVIVSVALDGTVTSWNPAAERLLGYAEADVVGQHWRPGVFPDGTRLVLALSEEALTRRVRVEDELRLRRADDALVRVHVVISPILAVDGSVDGYSFVARDVTLARHNEARLAEQLARLRALPEEGAPGVGMARDIPASSPEARVRATVDHVLAIVHERIGLDVAWLAELSGEELIPHGMAGERDVFGTDVGVPVRLADGKLYGALRASAHRTANELDEHDVELLEMLAQILSVLLENARLEHENSRLGVEHEVMSALLAALDARDNYTADHSQLVVALAVAVGRELELDGADVAEIEQVALLHDLGKVGIPDDILQKPGKLTSSEWALMHEHPAIGARIIGAIPSLAHLTAAIRAEHERWDGGGYPDGLAGEAIPLPSRVALACDAWHAMTSDRPYRAAIARDVALGELRAGAGAQFDPAVVDALVRVLERERR